MKGRVSSASVVGLRQAQEDRYVVADVRVGDGSAVLLAVLDGHGGDDVADACARALPELFEKTCGDTAECVGRLQGEHVDARAGTTLAMAAIVPLVREAVVAVIGDSMVWIRSADGSMFFSPQHAAARNRIDRDAVVARGAEVRGSYVWDPACGSGIALTRTIGAGHFRALLREPQTFRLKLGDDSWCLVASDGLLVPRSADAREAVVALIDTGASAEDLVNDALDHGSRDNVTALLWRYGENSKSGA